MKKFLHKLWVEDTNTWFEMFLAVAFGFSLAMAFFGPDCGWRLTCS